MLIGMNVMNGISFPFEEEATMNLYTSDLHLGHARERALNAGCMINNYMPATFKELVRNNQIFREHNN